MDLRRRQLIVRVRDGRLVLDKRRLEEKLRGLNGDGSPPKKCNILSVVGQRRSGKSTLAQNILKYIVNKFDADPWSPETERQSGGDDNDGKEAGISFQILSVHNKRHWLILMDVVGGLEADSSIYTRLIDFCLLTSTFVFYIEDLNQTTSAATGISWDLTRSTFYKRLDQHGRMSEYTAPSAFILLRGTGLVDIGGGVFSNKGRGRDQFVHRKFIQNLASSFLSFVLPQYQAKSSENTQNSEEMMTHFENFIKRSVSVVEDAPQTGSRSSKDEYIQNASYFLENSIKTLESWTEDEDLIDFKMEVTDDEDEIPATVSRPLTTQEPINPPAKYSPTHQSTSSNTSNGNGVSDAQFYNPAVHTDEPASSGQQKIAERQLIGFEPLLEKGIQCAESSPSQQQQPRDKDPAKNSSPTQPTDPLLNAAPIVASQENQEFDFQAAASTAIQKCVTFIKHRMENNIFTDSQIRQLHRDAYHCVTSAGVCSQLSSRNKELYISQVKKLLSECKKLCIIQNEQEIKRRVKERQRVLQETSQFFEKLLQEYLTTVGPNPKYREFAATAQELAARMYVEKCDKENLDHTNWFNFVNLKLEDRQGSVERRVGELRKGQEGGTYPLEHYEFLKRLKIVQDTVAPPPVHLALHLSPISLGAATSQGSTFRPKNMDWPLLISFQGSKTLIGKEAQGSKNAMDLFGMLQHCERSPAVVLVKKDHVELHIEEILSMFLFKVRREIESEFKVSIHSCVMVTSPFLSITAKQRLKTSLFLAGFQDTTLIQSHTAVALGFHYLGRETATPTPTPVRSRLLTLRETTESLEVAVLRLSDGGVTVQAAGVTTADQKSSSYKKLIVTTVNNSKISPQDISKLIPVFIKAAGGNVAIDRKGETQLARVIRKEKDLKPINLSGGKPVVDELSWILSSALRFKMLQSSTQIGELSTSSLSLSVRTLANVPLPQEKDILLLSPNQGLQAPGLTWTVQFPKLSPGTVIALSEGNWIGEERLVGHIETESAISTQIHISPEGLFQIINPSKVFGKIQFASHYLTPEEVTLSKDKLTTKYFKDKKYFDESWKLFLGSLESFHRARHDDGEPRFSSGKDSTSDSSDAVATNNVQKAKDKLREYMAKVERSLSQSDSGLISDRIREKVKQDLEQCANFLANAPQDFQVKDVERQLTRIQISTRPLKLS